MEKFSRAQRRADIARLKQNRKNYYNLGGSYQGIPHTERQLGRLVHTPTLCSCYCCGNPRKHFNAITCKEKLHIIDELFYLKAMCSDMM